MRSCLTVSNCRILRLNDPRQYPPARSSAVSIRGSCRDANALASRDTNGQDIRKIVYGRFQLSRSMLVRESDGYSRGVGALSGSPRISRG